MTSKDIVTKKEVEELMKKTKGEARGFCIREDYEYVFRREGKEGLKKLEEAMKIPGYNLKMEEISKLKFYPLGILPVLLLAISRLFNYNEKDFEDMGLIQSKISPLVRLFMQHLFSPEQMIKMVAKMWRTSFSVGDLRVVSYNKEEKSIIIRLENWELSPFDCASLRGYFAGFLGFSVKEKIISFKETKCTFRGDDYHEFLMKW